MTSEGPLSILYLIKRMTDRENEYLFFFSDAILLIIFLSLSVKDIKATTLVFLPAHSHLQFKPVSTHCLLAYAHVCVCDLVSAFLYMPTVLLKALVQQTVEVSLDQLNADAKPDFNVQTM